MPLIRPGLVALLLSACTAGLLVGAATSPAAAAPGEIREFAFPDAAATPQSLASDVDDLWITLRGTALLAKLLPGMAPSRRSLRAARLRAPGRTGSPSAHKRLWLAETTGNRISAVTAATGAVASFPLPQAGPRRDRSSRVRTERCGSPSSLGNWIGRITTTGTITEYTLAAGSAPDTITMGTRRCPVVHDEDGQRDRADHHAGRRVLVPAAVDRAGPQGITQGSDGNLWFTETTGNRIGRITPRGLIAEFRSLLGASGPGQIVAGADTNLWFTEIEGNRISRITTAGTITSYPIPTPGALPAGITSGVDGNIWFAESAGNRLGRVLTGVVPTSVAAPRVSGTSTIVGQQLTASTGSWNWLPTSFAYQWQRCATADAAKLRLYRRSHGSDVHPDGRRCRDAAARAGERGQPERHVVRSEQQQPAGDRRPAPRACSPCGERRPDGAGRSRGYRHPEAPDPSQARLAEVLRRPVQQPCHPGNRADLPRRPVGDRRARHRGTPDGEGQWGREEAVATSLCGRAGAVLGGRSLFPSPDQAGTVAAATLRRAITVRR